MAVAAPTVRSLQDTIAGLRQANQGQFDNIDQSIAQNQTAGDAQVAGIDAKKTKAFKEIGHRANSRGGYFSGFTPDQEAEYTASTYLPALANLQNTIASSRTALQGQKAKLDSGFYSDALGLQQGDQQSLNQWNMGERSIEASSSEAQKNRDFTASQSEKNNAFAASQNALGRAASASRSSRAGISSNPDENANKNAIIDITNFLESKKGRGDNHVSPKTFQDARSQWAAAGLNPALFETTYTNYINKSHGKDYYAE